MSCFSDGRTLDLSDLPAGPRTDRFAGDHSTNMLDERERERERTRGPARIAREIAECRRHAGAAGARKPRGESKNRRAAFPILFAPQTGARTHRRGAGSAFRHSNAVKKIFLK